VGQSIGNNTGVFGFSGSAGLPATPVKTGVYGYAVQDEASRGVWGRSNAGRGVYGQASTGRGVDGQATSGRGVSGTATTGTGGYFTATTGTALRAEGPVRFKTSGLATITTGTRSVTVTPGLDLTSSTKILALLQGDAGGSTAVQRVAIEMVANTFTIRLTANTVRNVRVSWFAIS
jgi:hypothetical protein